MRFLKQNTAINLTVGPFLDHADGLTPVDAMTVTDVDGVISYDDDDGSVGAHFAFSGTASGGDNDLVAVGHGGMWTLEVTAAQTNYTGRMMLCLWDPLQVCPVFHEFQVLAANVYDSLFMGLGPTADLLDVSVTQLAGTAQSLTDLKDLADTGYDPATHKVAGVVLTDTATTLTNPVTLANGAHGGNAASMNLASGLAANITGNITGNLSGTVGSVTGAVGSVTGAVASVTGAVGSVTGAVGSVTGNVGGTVASVVGNVGGNVVGTVASVVGAVGSVTGAVGSVAGAVASVTGAVGSVTGNVGGNVVGSVASVTGAVGSVTGAVGSVTGAVTLANGAHGGAAASMNLASGLAANITGNVTGNLSGTVGSVTGAVGSVTGAVASVTGAVGSVTGAVGSVTGNVGGNVVGSVASVTGAVGSVTGAVASVTGAVGSVTAAVTLPAVPNDWLAAAGVKADAVTKIQNGLATPTNITAGTITTVSGNVTGSVGSVAGNVTGSVASVAGAVGSVTGAVGSVTGAVGSVTGAVGSVTGAVGSVTGGVTLANGAHGGAAATLVLSDYSDFTGAMDAAGIRTAIGMAGADLDTQLDAIVADTGELQTDWANDGRLDLLLDAIVPGAATNLNITLGDGGAT